jgi:hypothetical protein
MVEIKTHRDHPASMAERITKRLNNSGDAKNSDVVVQKGSGPTRTYSNIDHSRNEQYGEGHPGEGDIRANKRGVV